MAEDEEEREERRVEVTMTVDVLGLEDKGAARRVEGPEAEAEEEVVIAAVEAEAAAGEGETPEARGSTAVEAPEAADWALEATGEGDASRVVCADVVSSACPNVPDPVGLLVGAVVGATDVVCSLPAGVVVEGEPAVVGVVACASNGLTEPNTSSVITGRPWPWRFCMIAACRA